MTTQYYNLRSRVINIHTQIKGTIYLFVNDIYQVVYDNGYVGYAEYKDLENIIYRKTPC